MADEIFDWRETAQNWQDFLGQTIRDGATVTWDAITNPQETGSAIWNSAEPTVQAIYEELSNLGELGVEESRARLEPLFDSAVEAGALTAEEVAEFGQRLWGGEISWEDTKSYFAAMGEGFVETAQDVGEGAAQAFGNIARSLPFMATAAATIGITYATVSGMVGATSLFSLKGLLAGVLTFAISTVAVPMIAGGVHNWWYGHNNNAAPTPEGEGPVREAALTPERAPGLEVTQVNLDGVEVASVQMAVLDTDRIDPQTLPDAQSSVVERA